MQRALLIMAKRPSPGRTKRRLSPPLSELQAAELYECFLKDTIDIVATLNGITPFIAWAPTNDPVYFRRIAPGFKLMRQKGSGLAERLNHVLTICLEAGYDQVAAINSDSPTLPAEYLSRAFDLLDEVDIDVVLGPTDDGGYYLIGWKRPHSRLIGDVTMSTTHVLEDTLDIARQERLNVSLLPRWYDVDEVSDLLRLRAETRVNPDIGKRSGAFLDALNQDVKSLD